MKSAKGMAPDTKVPDGRKDGQRQNNIPPPMAGDNKVHKVPLLRYNEKCLFFSSLKVIFKLNQDIIKTRALSQT